MLYWVFFCVCASSARVCGVYVVTSTYIYLFGRGRAHVHRYVVGGSVHYSENKSENRDYRVIFFLNVQIQRGDRCARRAHNFSVCVYTACMHISERVLSKTSLGCI